MRNWVSAQFAAALWHGMKRSDDHEITSMAAPILGREVRLFDAVHPTKHAPDDQLVAAIQQRGISMEKFW